MAKQIPSYLLPGAEPLVGQEPSGPAGQSQADVSLYDSIGLVVRELRQEQGKSMEELANEAGTTANVIWGTENHSSTPTMDSIGRIADGLNASVEEVMMRCAAKSAGVDLEIVEPALKIIRESAGREDTPGFQQAFGTLMEDLRDVHEVDTALEVAERTNYSRSTYYGIRDGGTQDSGSGTYFGMAGAFERDGTSAAEVIALAAAEAVGIHPSESDDPENDPIRKLLDEMKNRG